MSKKNKMGITGMWIPGEVAFNKELTLNDMFVWWVINSLDCSENNCWASNEYIAKLCGSHSQTVSSSIAKLKKHGYIKQISFDGRIRRLAICTDYVKKYKELTKNYNKLINGESKSAPRIRLSRTTEAASRNDLEIYNKEEYKKEEEKYLNVLLDSENPIAKKPPLEKKPPKHPDPETYPKPVQELFNYWQSLKIVRHPASKTRTKGLNQLNAILGKYSVDTVKESMARYKELLEDNDSILINEDPYKVGLDQFFGFNSYNKDRITRNLPKLEFVRSWFKECQKEDLTHLMRVRPNPFPEITIALKKGYSHKIGKVNGGTHNENAFRKASHLLMDFHSKHKERLTLQLQKKPGIFASCLIDYLAEAPAKGSSKHPGWLCTDITWNVFKGWLTEKGYYCEEDLC